MYTITAGVLFLRTDLCNTENPKTRGPGPLGKVSGRTRDRQGPYRRRSREGFERGRQGGSTGTEKKTGPVRPLRPFKVHRDDPPCRLDETGERETGPCHGFLHSTDARGKGVARVRQVYKALPFLVLLLDYGLIFPSCHDHSLRVLPSQ